MKTISIRDLRQRWPEAEKALAVAGELVVTRDSRPVARLVRYTAKRSARRRFDPEAHAVRQAQANGGRVTRWVEEGLLRERDER
jgi:antitoxin (DNA-binding transcriptional repressor) of toxin-antitoxin stability system